MTLNVSGILSDLVIVSDLVNVSDFVIVSDLVNASDLVIVSDLVTISDIVVKAHFDCNIRFTARRNFFLDLF